MAKSGGSLGAPNSVAWMFKAKGLITVKKDGAPSADSVMELALATAEQSMIPDNLVTESESDAAKVLKLMELLEGFDDVKNVYGILDIPDADKRTRAFAFVHAGWGGGAGVAGVGVSFGAVNGACVNQALAWCGEWCGVPMLYSRWCAFFACSAQKRSTNTKKMRSLH